MELAAPEEAIPHYPALPAENTPDHWKAHLGHVWDTQYRGADTQQYSRVISMASLVKHRSEDASGYCSFAVSSLTAASTSALAWVSPRSPPPVCVDRRATLR